MEAGSRISGLQEKEAFKGTDYVVYLPDNLDVGHQLPSKTAYSVKR